MKRVEIEEALHDAYKETDLLKFEAKLALEKQLTRLEHFDVVTDDELMVNLCGIVIFIFVFSLMAYQHPRPAVFAQR